MLITICICTCGRLRLADTLSSVTSLALPPGFEAEVLVVDNDAGGPARAIVEKARASALHPIRLVEESRRGLCFARNKSLAEARGDWLALIDDDEIAEPDWLLQLVAAAERFKADAVIGTVLPLYKSEPPEFITASRMLEHWLPETGSTVSVSNALTGNAFIRRELLSRHGIAFDPAYNTTGGEDSEFYSRFIGHGGRVVSCREAVVHEQVPAERMTEDYLRRLALRKGETYARMKQDRGGPVALLTVGARATANTIVAAALMLALRMVRKRSHWHYRVLMLRNIGKLRYIVGFPGIEMYAGPRSTSPAVMQTPLKVP